MSGLGRIHPFVQQHADLEEQDARERILQLHGRKCLIRPWIDEKQQENGQQQRESCPGLQPSAGSDLEEINQKHRIQEP